MPPPSPYLRIARILFPSPNTYLDITYIVLLILARAKVAELLSEAARIRLAKFGTSELRSALMSYAAAVVVLSPVDMVFNGVVRNVQGRLAHRLVKELNVKCVGSSSYDHGVITDSADKFVDLALKLAIEALEGSAHLLIFYKLLNTIHPTMAKMCIATSMGGTLVSMWLSSRLPELFYKERMAESNLTYHLVRTRENAESIQFYGGRKAEVEEADALDFERQIAIRNRKFAKDQVEQFSKLLRSLAGGIIPVWLSSSNTSTNQLSVNPTHGKMGTIKMDDHHHHHDDDNVRESSSRLVQASEAFDEILLHLLLFSENAHDFSRLNTSAQEICDALDNSPFTMAAKNKSIQHVKLEKRSPLPTQPWLIAEKLCVRIPGSVQDLITDLTFQLAYGETLLITGASGSGKTALLRVLVGIWSEGTGHAIRPLDEEILFLPQKPYCVGGCLADEVMYPLPRDKSRDGEVLKALQRVGLSHVVNRGGLDRTNMAKELSLGEQQRLAFARVALHKPRFACCDESSSALDVNSESAMYEMLSEVCIGGYVSVGHRKSIERYHTKKIVLNGDETRGWTVEF